MVSSVLHLKYRPDIDGLRTVAVLAVVVFHAFPTLMSGGFVGVDVFFVISGYLITSLILTRQPDNFSGKEFFSFRTFYANRVRRIFPALICVLLACLIFGWFTLLADEYKELGKETVAGAAFLQNIALWGEAGYFDTAAELKPLLHLWSLGIEEQFYLCWPILLIIAFRFQFNSLLFVSAIAITSFSANLLMMQEHVTAAFYSPFTRMWELMAGGALACIHSPHGRPSDSKRMIVFGGCFKYLKSNNLRSNLGILLILGTVFLINKTMPFPGWLALLPTAGAFLVISGGMNAWVNLHILSSRPFVFVGLVSYPFYLWHWPLLSFARILEGESPRVVIRLSAVILAFILACLTYWLIERRVRVIKHWGMTFGLTCALALVGGIGYNIFDRDGLQFRLKSSELKRVKFNITLSYQNQCRLDFPFAAGTFCLRGSEDSPPSVAIIGDSHAQSLYQGLGIYYANRGDNVVNFGTGGGIPFYGVDRMVDGRPTDGYSKLYASILDYVLHDQGIHTIILMNQSVWDGDRHEPLFYNPDPSNSDTLDIYRKAMSQTLSRLLQAHKRIIFVIDNPSLDFDPAACIPRPASLVAVKNPCAIPRAEYDSKIAPFRKVIDEVLAQFPTVVRWDLAEELCDDDYCWAIKDGQMLYSRDGTHLSAQGSRWLAERFVPDK